MSTLNFVLALCAIIVLLGSTILVLDQYSSRVLESAIKAWGMMVGFVLALGTMVFPLIYSEVFGFVPCGLCWLQRIFLFPQTFILAAALWYKDKAAARYGIVLSVPGLLIALYQYYLQMGGGSFIACPAAAGDCARRYIFEFGFVTMPFMAVAAFAFLIALYLYILSTVESTNSRREDSPALPG
jgi:disulfide bond formation protein DsbB